MKTKQLLVLLSIGAIGFALTGCSSSDEAETENTKAEEEVVEEEVVEETVEEPAESEDTGAGAAPAGDVTAPGTELAFGEGAVVPLEYANETGLVEIKPVEIVKGDPSDLDDLDLGAQGEGITPYYITVEVTGVDEASANLTYASVNGDLDALLEGGDDADLISIIGRWAPCESESAPGDFGPGVTFTTCVPGFSTSDTPVAGIQFSPFEGEYNTLDGSPVVWTK